jgi:hypothetical protein
MQPEYYQPGDFVFEEGGIGKEMFFITKVQLMIQHTLS